MASAAVTRDTLFLRFFASVYFFFVGLAWFDFVVAFFKFIHLLTWSKAGVFKTRTLLIQKHFPPTLNYRLTFWFRSLTSMTLQQEHWASVVGSEMSLGKNIISIYTSAKKVPKTQCRPFALIWISTLTLFRTSYLILIYVSLRYVSPVSQGKAAHFT